MAKASSNFDLAGRPAAGACSTCAARVMHHVGHSATQMSQAVQACGNSAIDPCG